MLNKQNFSKTLLAATLLAAFGQAAANDADTQALDTVKVTSGSMNRLGVVPFRQAKSAVAISNDELRQQGVEKTDELGRYQAGFSNQVFGSDNNTEWFRIRGTEATQAIDGKPAFAYGFFSPRTEMYGMETAEITKGADSLTFGAAQAGGLINFISKRAHSNQVGQGEVKLHIGNMKQSGIAGDYTGGLNADNSLRYRVVGSVKQTDGEWKGSKNKTIYIAPSLQWDITPKTQLSILSSYQQDKGVPSSNFLPQEGTLFAFPNGTYINPKSNYGDPITDTETNKQFGIGYELSHKFNKNLTFDSSYRYGYVDSYHRGTYIGGAVNYLPENNYAPSLASSNGYTLSRATVFNDGTAKSHGFDNRLTYKFKNDWINNTLVAGFDFRKQQSSGLYDDFLTQATRTDLLNVAANHGQMPDVSAAPYKTSKAQQLGFYLQNQAKIQKFNIGLGIRHDRAKNSNYASVRSIFADSQDLHQQLKKNHTSYSASVMYQAPFGFNPYVSYNESFRLPMGIGLNQALYDPAITKQTEIGVKYLPNKIDGQFSLAAFRAKDKGALESKIDTSTGKMGTASTKDEGVRKGVELQADMHINDNWKAGLSYTYLRSVANTPKGDERLPYIAKNSAALHSSYSFDSGSLNGLTVGGGVRYVGSSVSKADYPFGQAKVPAFTLFDLSARYNFAKNWTAQVNVDNLTNKKYVAACDWYCYYGQGRNINASLSYRFQ